MIKINIRPLPNARIPYDDAKDPALRKKVMLLNDNIVSLSTQLTEAQKAVIELQKRPSGGGGGGGGGGDAEYWARIAQQAARSSQDSSSSASGHATTARTAKDGAVSAKDDAVAAKDAAVAAKGDAVTARNDALSAKEAAIAAKEAAEEAARSASGSIKVKEFAITVNVDAGSVGAYSAYVDPDTEVGTDHIPILAVCSYSGYQKLCATQCNLSYLATGRWSVGIYIYNPDSKSHSGYAKVMVLYVPGS